MTKRMLIDAAHAEETRVVVVDGTRVEEFDFESRSRKQLRGNIYLAKVTRVEPSLQAAFVEYGGNRHGFLAFNEIHPDYYQIPLADREALMREEADDEDDHHHGSHANHDGEDGEDDELFTITDITDDKVVVDGNHPLAGVALNFICTIADVRQATAEEISHGHIHGDGGHHH